jgi:hypothetical protein
MSTIVEEPKIIGANKFLYTVAKRKQSLLIRRLELIMSQKKQCLQMLPILIPILKKKIYKEMSRFLHLD